jgi:hypothetical protein
MARDTRVLLIGPGDLGLRLAAGLASLPEVGELVLAGRHPRRGHHLAALCEACGTVRVRFCEVDVHQTGDLERLLRRERPQLVVQCAADLSPWWVGERPDALAAALVQAGFALQLPVQLPLVASVMQAVRSAGLEAPVVNASYPDLTHPILAARGLAPTIGIGNAGMIEARVRAVLRRRPEIDGAEPIRVAAHHAHLTPVVLARPPAPPATRPRVYLGEPGRRADELAFAGPPLPAERQLNALAAAAGLPLLRALLGGPPLRTSAPGPAGLPGGWPVRVEAGRIDIDLPPDVGSEELNAFQWESARQDGVERVEADGTVVFTAAARAALSPWTEELAEPLTLDRVEERRALLYRSLGIGPADAQPTRQHAH